MTSWFAEAELNELKQVFKLLYRSQLRLEEALIRIESQLAGPHAAHVVKFVRGSERGIARPHGSRGRGV